MRRALLFLALVAVMLPGRAAPITFTDTPRLDLKDRVEWCESATEMDAAAIAAGGCRFSPSSPQSLKRGFTTQAVWLRLTLSNPAPTSAERWLQVGHTRLMHVTFFESTPAGWRRTEAGVAIPLARRTVRTVDPILPLTLAPAEHRTILVRVESVSMIDAAPTLWQPNAYSFVNQRNTLYAGIGIGTLIASAIFILSIYFLWHARAYLYLCAFVIAVVLFSASHSGLVQVYFWPANWPFDLRFQILAGAAAGIFFALFAVDFADTKTKYRRHYTLIRLLVWTIIAAAAWTDLIDYHSGARSLTFLILATVAASALLLLRSSALGIVKLPLIVFAGFIFIRTVMMGIGITSGDNNAAIIRYIWTFLLTCVPAALVGLLAFQQRMQMQLQASEAESAARVDFLARMSHELRTPLDIIIGTAQLLANPHHRARLEQGLADISANGRHLLKMIDEVLDYSRGLIGKLTIMPGPVNWPEFLRTAEHDAKVLAARSGNTASMTVSGEALAGFHLDEKRLKQVLDNLVANAARHTKNGWIRIACNVSPAEEKGKWRLAFAVTDCGEGIPPEDIDRIFLPFERGENTARHGGKGVGMGLAISLQLVELMGGTLCGESEPGHGAKFSFYVIAEAAGEAEVKGPFAQSIAGYTGSRRTILIVDDESGNRAILAALLRDAGFDVLEAESGQTAVACCDETQVDAVVTDQFMADGDGWYVLRHVAESWPSIPVILISAAPPDRPTDLPENIDFAATLLKPLNHSEVLRCIGDLLGLTWIEAPEKPEATETEPICRPGEAELQDLRDMIEAGRISDILSWTEALKARDARYADFAERIHAAARDLDFAVLNDLAGFKAEA